MVSVTPFTWANWPALWMVRRQQLAEHGIHIAAGDLPAAPQPDSPYEWDFHHIAEVYLNGAGGFWLARVDGETCGYVGAQDMNGALELRRMYVAAAFRRRGVGARLVRALLDHAAAYHTAAVELWTDASGHGRALYARLGFHPVAAPGPEFADVTQRTRHTPHAGEIRMRLDLTGEAEARQ